MKEQKPLIGSLVAVVSALAASSCCWLPLLLIAVGAGSAVTIISYIEPYRIPASIVALVALAFAFYYTFRRPKGASGSCSTEVSCCAPSAKVRVFHTINKIMLFFVTIVVLAMLFFPEAVISSVAGIGGGQENGQQTGAAEPDSVKGKETGAVTGQESGLQSGEEEKLKVVTVHVDGMT